MKRRRDGDDLLLRGFESGEPPLKQLREAPRTDSALAARVLELLERDEQLAKVVHKYVPHSVRPNAQAPLAALTEALCGPTDLRSFLRAAGGHSLAVLL